MRRALKALSISTPISYLLLYGDFYYSQEVDMAQSAELLAFVAAELPEFKAITINGDFFHNAAATSVQELAFTLSSAAEYIAFLTEAGFTVDDVASRINICFWCWFPITSWKSPRSELLVTYGLR